MSLPALVPLLPVLYLKRETMPCILFLKSTTRPSSCWLRVPFVSVLPIVRSVFSLASLHLFSSRSLPRLKCGTASVLSVPVPRLRMKGDVTFLTWRWVSWRDYYRCLCLASNSTVYRLATQWMTSIWPVSLDTKHVSESNVCILTSLCKRRPLALFPFVCVRVCISELLRMFYWRAFGVVLTLNWTDSVTEFIPFSLCLPLTSVSKFDEVSNSYIINN
jgi:hypothetical protein